MLANTDKDIWESFSANVCFKSPALHETRHDFCYAMESEWVISVVIFCRNKSSETSPISWCRLPGYTNLTSAIIIVRRNRVDKSKNLG
jgi:hypothetical protein